MDRIFSAALPAAASGIRVFMAIIAGIFVVRSVGATCLPVRRLRFLYPFIMTTGLVVEPVRKLLPGSMGGRKPDFASLVVAIFFLVFGLGVNELFLLIAHGL